MYVGGPGAAGLDRVRGRVPGPDAAGLLVLGRIGFPSSDTGIDELAEATAAGVYLPATPAGARGSWTPSSKGDWIAQAALPEDVFTDAPADLWSGVLAARAAPTR